MKDWQTLFDIASEHTTITRFDGTTFERMSYFVVDKFTGEKIFPQKRKYGYSTKMDAQRGAAHMYRNHMKIMEKVLLG